MRPDHVCPFSIRLFGPFEVRVSGRPLPPLRFQRGQLVLAMLVLRGGCPVERDRLAGLLWPASATSAALHNLRNCLTALRPALGPEAGRLTSPTPRTLSLDLTGASVDVLAFDAGVSGSDSEALEEAVALYRGPLLEGWTEEWIFQERERREQAYLAARETLVRAALERGERGEAEHHLRCAVATDPLRESAQRSLMELLARGGNYAAALLAYRELRQRLHRELNAEPDPETQALFHRLRTEAREKASATRRTCATRFPRPSPVPASDRNGGNEEHPQALHEALAFPPPLPLPLTRFFGREAEIAALVDLLRGRDARLVTLTGPGGSGKTRLALQVGEALRESLQEGTPPGAPPAAVAGGRSAGGPWFVPLLALSDPRLIPERLLQALGLPHLPQRDPLEQIAAALHSRPSWLILDNFEQLVEGGAGWVQTLLERVRTLTILVTSRKCLGVPGEREFTVAPLPVPSPRNEGRATRDEERCGRPSSLVPHSSSLLDYPSVQLFVDRAQAVQADFRLTAGNAAAVAELCRRLEGLPLAIVLAAARVRVLTPWQMLERLEQRFDLLVNRRGIMDPRHRSLRAALDWSYQLLSPELQRFFARLSVFRGGWTLEAAEAVCTDFGSRILDFGLGQQGFSSTKDTNNYEEGLTEPGPPQVGPLSRPFVPLVDRSEIQNPNATPGPEGTRYPAPEIQNEMALEFLEELRQCSLVVTETTGEEMRYRMLEMVREYGAEQLTPDEQASLAERHLAYYRELVEKTRPGYTGRPLRLYYDHLEREQDNLRAALDCWIRCGAALVWILTIEQPGWTFISLLICVWRDRGYATEGRRRLAEILALPGAAVSTTGRAWLLRWAGELAVMQGNWSEANALVEESLAVHEAAGRTWFELDCCELLAVLARDQGDYARARSLYERLLDAARDGRAPSHLLTQPLRIASSLCELGYTACLEGDMETGQSLMETALGTLRTGQEAAWACVHLGKAAGTPYDYPASAAHLSHIARVCAHLGEVADARGDYAAARVYLEESLAIFGEFGNGGDISYMLHQLGRVSAHQDHWEAARNHFAASLAMRERAGDKLGVAMGLNGLAAVAGCQGDPERAARLLGAASTLRETCGIPLPPFERADRERTIEQARSALGEKAFAAAWAEGQALPLDAMLRMATKEALAE